MGLFPHITQLIELKHSFFDRQTGVAGKSCFSFCLRRQIRSVIPLNHYGELDDNFLIPIPKAKNGLRKIIHSMSRYESLVGGSKLVQRKAG